MKHHSTFSICFVNPLNHSGQSHPCRHRPACCITIRARFPAEVTATLLSHTPTRTGSSDKKCERWRNQLSPSDKSENHCRRHLQVRSSGDFKLGKNLFKTTVCALRTLSYICLFSDDKKKMFHWGLTWLSAVGFLNNELILAIWTFLHASFLLSSVNFTHGSVKSLATVTC